MNLGQYEISLKNEETCTKNCTNFAHCVRTEPPTVQVVQHSTLLQRRSYYIFIKGFTRVK